MARNRLVELAKKIIRTAGELGLDAAGTAACGPAWPFVKKILTPVVEELQKRFPKLFLMPEEATKAADALARDRALQGMIQAGFAELQEGQDLILAALVRQDAALLEIGHAVDVGFRAAGRKVDEASDSISRELKALRLEIAELRAAQVNVRTPAAAKPQPSLNELVYRAGGLQYDAMASIARGEVDQAARRLSEARKLVRVGLREQPRNLDLLVVLGFVEKTEAQVALLRSDYELYVKSVAEATKCFAEVLGRRPDDVGALNGMANIYAFHGMHDQAIQLGTLALRLQPEYAAAAWDLALALEAKIGADGPQPGLVRNLVAVYDRLTRLMPAQPGAFTEREVRHVTERLAALRRSLPARRTRRPKGTA